MTGKVLAGLIVAIAACSGVAIYYLQVYHFYDSLPPQDALTLTTADGGTVSVPVSGFDGIDADSSPIRYRACMDLDLSSVPLSSLDRYDGAAPRNAPHWFGCFDADAIGAAIAAGTAQVYTGTRNLEFGIDRVVAITDKGRAYVWHEVNDCGDKAYDGSPLGDDCPPRPKP